MNEEMLREVPISEKVIHTGRIIRFEEMQVRLPNGHTAAREIIRHKGASAVVALDNGGNLLLVNQWRAPIDRMTLEIPAGKLDHVGEDPLDAAKRELSEETGYSAENWRKLVCMDTTPGFCDEHIHLYLATGLTAGETHPDDDEFIDVTRMPMTEAFEKARDGFFRDGKTALGILMAAAVLGVYSK